MGPRRRGGRVPIRAEKIVVNLAEIAYMRRQEGRGLLDYLLRISAPVICLGASPDRAWRHVRDIHQPVSSMYYHYGMYPCGDIFLYNQIGFGYIKAPGAFLWMLRELFNSLRNCLIQSVLHPALD